ncbi:MAG: glycine cleavage system protein GcvH [Candidatus Bipolaricaulis sp.]|nr:glycine cleavage system protein GcvH [Candidatus Bipolaricaulis sp.]MDD5646166.1 glycine cleavage system protein GcvH [Candidatus Bipolaricaulis sp.]
MSYPTGYRYTKEHEWVKVEGSRARVGITDHAQAELGDVVFVELPTVGADVKQGGLLGTVESVKAVSDINAPVSGKVIEVNRELESSPETVNQAPHDAGWIAVIELANPSETASLLDAAAYEALLA